MRDVVLPWLYGVARNVLTNFTRGTARSRRLVDKVGQQVDGTTGASPAGAAADHSDEVVGRLTLAAAFDTLPERAQESLRLVAWEGLEPAADTALSMRRQGGNK